MGAALVCVPPFIMYTWVVVYSKISNGMHLALICTTRWLCVKGISHFSPWNNQGRGSSQRKGQRSRFN
jgi:hypothetical protein